MKVEDFLDMCSSRPIQQFSLGDIVCHTLTGYTGVVVSYCFHLGRSAEVRVLDVSVFDPAQGYPAGPWFPADMLELVTKKE